MQKKKKRIIASELSALTFSLLQREYLSSAVNVLKNSPKIFHITKRDFFQLNRLHSHHKLYLRCCLLDFNSV